ncbi:MAG: HAD family phosphatase [Rhodobacter sp.]|nr:HAD family phosphatase [Rhodobacter sp.]
MGAIDAVVFDIGNVLVEWHPFRPFDRILGEAQRKALFAEVDFMGANERCDLGADIVDEIEALARAHPDKRDQVMIWLDRYMEMLAPELPHSARMLRALRARGQAVFALSNFGHRTFVMSEEVYPILTEFDRRFISGQLGLMKPDPAIYARVETETGIAPERLFFIDDRQDNIDAAAARGWQVHLFTGEAGLAERLVEEGLLTEDEAVA